MQNQVRPVCSPKDKIWLQTDKLQRCRRLPLEQAKLRQILENKSKGVLFRKWLVRWYVEITFSFRNILNLGEGDRYFLYKMQQFPQYPPGWIYPGLPSGNMFNDRGDPSSSPSTTSLMTSDDFWLVTGIPSIQQRQLNAAINPAKLLYAVHICQPRTGRLRTDGVKRRKSF